VLGKETIDLYNTSETRSTNNSYGLNYQKVGKELLYSFVMNSVAHNKKMNRDTTSELITKYKKKSQPLYRLAQWSMFYSKNLVKLEGLI
jgi:hypothetical protein